jgi:hypothetical protein
VWEAWSVAVVVLAVQSPQFHVTDGDATREGSDVCQALALNRVLHPPPLVEVRLVSGGRVLLAFSLVSG